MENTDKLKEIPLEAEDEPESKEAIALAAELEKETTKYSIVAKIPFPSRLEEKQKTSTKTFIQEREFDSLMIICKEIWPLVRYHRWEHFWMISKDIVVVFVIQEFYASLRDQESRSSEGHMWETEKEPRESEEEGKDDKEGNDEMDFEKDV
ncbi:hypothetical protein Goari_003011 [Gossypium aridum]|uniref:Uncharacterized protein n=1 Tax=Gossypium aridum TaxID=34290 RepID=A0A7J8YAY4_GOSAI|nr:hypothetical protein [Gossypium aridum]